MTATPRAPLPPFSEDDRHHFALIQAVVTRLAGNQFLVKGWALTIAAALLGYASAHREWEVAALGIPVAFAFWGLDAYFLRQERLFRRLWVASTTRPATVPIYSLDVTPYRQDVPSFAWTRDENQRRRAGAALAGPVIALHGLIVTACTLIALAIGVHH